MARDAEIEQAEAVLDGLADVLVICECGRKHERDEVLQRRKRIYCNCGNNRRIEYRYTKKRGWAVSRRNLLAWRAYEKQLLARIAELEHELHGYRNSTR